MTERGNPLFAVTQVTRKEHPKHVSFMKARTSTLETKQIMIERGNPLFVLYEEQSNSSLGTTKQNQICRSGSRSFLDWVNDQVRKRQKRSSMNVREDGEKHFVIWRMFMSSALEPSVTMGKNYSDNWHSIKNTRDLTMEQMFDMSAILVSEQDEILGVKTNDWENFSW